MKNTLLLFITACLFYCFPLLSQKDSMPVFKDTILFLNGDVMPAMLKDSSADGVRLIRPTRKGKKEVFIESDRIFSIKYANGSETIIYKRDSLIGNELTVEEARFFMIGERDAKNFFKARGATAGGILVGAASAATIGSVISFIPPFAYSAILMLPKIKIRKNMVSDPELIKNDAYMMGYERVARKKRMMNSLIGGGVGIVAGFVAYSIRVNN